MAEIDGLIIAKVKKAKRREWFGTCWKSQKEFFNSEFNVRQKEYEGSPIYDNLREYLDNFCLTHTGCRWAYTVHEKGHNLDKYYHNNCEHKHFVIVMDNPCSGASVMKHFEGCYIEYPRYTIEHCCRYLLHLSASSLNKERIKADDLYCSGQGEHGQVWFPIVAGNLYETFDKNNVLQYVYNEGCTSIKQFSKRFGSGVLTGANLQIIESILKDYQKQKPDVDFVKAVFKELPRNEQLFIYREFFRIPDSQAEFATIDEFSDDEIERSMISKTFEKVYIWWKCSSVIASDQILQYLRDYDLQALLTENNNRLELKNIIDSNSVFGEDIQDKLFESEIN